ncbi:peptide-methionine (S)-S-oxide reductase [Oceanimonas sp. NS1]|nr:peptide-methionine (S)-S-oxide reductase [Oceanimonas sp. NS1]
MSDEVLGLLPNDFPDIDDGAFRQTGERTLVLAGGCFWCTEAVYRQLEGVIAVISATPAATPTPPITRRCAPAPPAMPKPFKSPMTAIVSARPPC